MVIQQGQDSAPSHWASGSGASPTSPPELRCGIRICVLRPVSMCDPVALRFPGLVATLVLPLRTQAWQQDPGHPPGSPRNAARHSCLPCFLSISLESGLWRWYGA